MLDVPGHIVPRPSRSASPRKASLPFWSIRSGPQRASFASSSGSDDRPLRTARKRFRTDVERPLLVARHRNRALPYAAQIMGNPPIVLGFRTRRQAEAAKLIPGPRLHRAPTRNRADSGRPHRRARLRAEPMLHAVRALALTLSWPGRLPWPAASAPATAAWSSSRESPGGSASRGRC